MKNWAIAFGLLGCALAIAIFVHTLRHYRPSKRHLVAGGFASFTMGLLVVLAASLPSHWVVTLTELILLGISMLFLFLEIRFWRQDRDIELNG